MDDWKVPLADVVLSDEDLAAVVAAYRSGWLSIGPRTAAFEAAFAEYVGREHAVAVSSGTAALHLMCLAAGLGPGDEVLVPSMTYIATVNAVRYVRATPVFVDIAGPLEPWMSAERCERALTPHTRAILYMAYGGHPGALRALVEVADRAGVVLLQDAAHAVGSRLDGRAVGGFGHAAAFSFFSNKNLSIGEGGMVATDDERLARDVRLLRSHGMTALSWERHRGHAGDTAVTILGFNYRFDDPRAALGLSRLRRLDDDNARRSELDARYRERLSGLVGCAMPPAPGVSSAHYIFTIVLPEDVDRAAFRERLGEDGIQTSVHYPAAHRLSGRHDRVPDLPVTDDYADRTVTLPLFPHMTPPQQDAVVDAVSRALDR